MNLAGLLITPYLQKVFEDGLRVPRHLCYSDENEIDVDKNEIETTGNFVHEMLKSLCCVAETKRHLGEVEQTKWCGDGSFTNIFLGHVLVWWWMLEQGRFWKICMVSPCIISYCMLVWLWVDFQSCVIG